MDPIFQKTNAGQTTRYVYANGLRVAKVQYVGNPPTCTTSYFLGDHLGSTRKMLDAYEPDPTPDVPFSTEYEPFGTPYAVMGTDPHKYTMEKHDDPTGLVYLRARQYDPEIGRFVSADPVLGSLSRPQTLNRYTYVVNNPLKYADPTGLAYDWSRAPPCTAHPNPDMCEGARAHVDWEEANAALLANVPPCALLECIDRLMMVIGVVPVLGDIASTAWFLGRDVQECLASGCNWVNIGLDAVGLIPFVPALGGAVHLARAANRAANIAPIVGRSGNLFDISGVAFRQAYHAGGFGSMPMELARGRFAHDAILGTIHGFNIGPSIGKSARGGSLFPDAWRQGHIIEIKPWHGGVIENSWRAQVNGYIGAHSSLYGTRPLTDFVFYRFV